MANVCGHNWSYGTKDIFALLLTCVQPFLSLIWQGLWFVFLKNIMKFLWWCTALLVRWLHCSGGDHSSPDHWFLSLICQSVWFLFLKNIMKNIMVHCSSTVRIIHCLTSGFSLAAGWPVAGSGLATRTNERLICIRTIYQWDFYSGSSISSSSAYDHHHHHLHWDNFPMRTQLPLFIILIIKRPRRFLVIENSW